MLAATRNAVKIQGRASVTRAVSTRASKILSSLGISSEGEVHGVYDGQWRGSGEIMVSTCPTTGEELAHIRTASGAELREAVERTREAYMVFRSELSVFGTQECKL
jgi:aldehyde dehydrogenase family 7 protein A1